MTDSSSPGLLYGVLFSTQQPVNEVERWLAAHCQGKFRLEVEGIDIASQRRDLRLFFEIDGERQAFQQAFGL